MYGSLIGNNFRVMTFGESHGPAVGVVAEGLPAGIKIELSDIQKDLDRRRPGKTPFASPRNEPDLAEILSGFTREGRTNGAPIAILIRNTQAKSEDYAPIQDKFRPGHADLSYFLKYGLKPQPGGGRASGRETAARVAAGALARAFLAHQGIEVQAGVLQVGKILAKNLDFPASRDDPLYFLDPQLSPLAQKEVEQAMAQGNSVGGIVELQAHSLPPGWGEPVFGKLFALLGGAFFSIGAVRAVEFGEGIKLASLLGSEANDPLSPEGYVSNRHGGALGGISTGEPLIARLFVKPTPTIKIPQETLDLKFAKTTISAAGRHDPCVAPRLAPVAEAMCLLVLADLALARKAQVEEKN
ncbi:MAG: chorismate synthase [Deltaproteobacteria bacterium]|jgi:chorismate synthase|nr:chorismate synthase [Deltaproteobacteria bacterium]